MASAPQLEAKLKEIVADEREAAVERLVGGLADYPAYREEVGFVRALDQFGEWCADAAKQLDER
jgi:hypothetical protein